jgi:hypothetical protein
MNYTVSFVDADDTGILNNYLFYIEADTKEDALVKWFKDYWMTNNPLDSSINDTEDDFVKDSIDIFDRRLSINSYKDISLWINLFEYSGIFIFDESLKKVLTLGKDGTLKGE